YVVGSVDITATMKRLGIRMETPSVNATSGLLYSSSIFDVNNDINIVPCYLSGTGVSPKEAGVKVEIYSFEHDKVDPDFLVENSGQHHYNK
ncbi:33806_t:CDS:1, partial [Racocetra persica]